MFSTGSEEVVEDGKLRITKEGNAKKFVDKVDQITFSGKFAQRKNYPVFFITERGVFKLENRELILIEIAPGVDLEKDILGMMEFKPRISPDLASMDPSMFLPEWGRLKEALDKKGQRELIAAN
jgi:propionate CoA-transferase